MFFHDTLYLLPYMRKTTLAPFRSTPYALATNKNFTGKPSIELTRNDNLIKLLCEYKGTPLRSTPWTPSVQFKKGFRVLTNNMEGFMYSVLLAARKKIPYPYWKDTYSLNGGYTPSFAERLQMSGKFTPMQNWRWYVADDAPPSSGGTVRQSGGGIGRLDAANEEGFFFKINRSRLKKLKQTLKDKTTLKDKETPADKKSEQ